MKDMSARSMCIFVICAPKSSLIRATRSTSTLSMVWDIALLPKKRPTNNAAWRGGHMRSLTVKLTLAFLLVGTIGALLVAVLVGQRTRSEFDRFLSEHDQSVLMQALSGYYASHGTWDGVGRMLASTPPLDFYSRGMTLVNPDGIVAFSNDANVIGQPALAGTLDNGTSLQVSGRTVGYMLF